MHHHSGPTRFSLTRGTHPQCFASPTAVRAAGIPFDDGDVSWVEYVELSLDELVNPETLDARVNAALEPSPTQRVSEDTGETSDSLWQKTRRLAHRPSLARQCYPPLAPSTSSCIHPKSWFGGLSEIEVNTNADPSILPFQRLPSEYRRQDEFHDLIPQATAQAFR